MNKKQIYKYLDCKTTQAEEAKVLKWINENEENGETFAKIRKEWEMLCLRSDIFEDVPQRNKPRIISARFSPVLKIACSLLIGFIIGFLYIGESSEENMLTIVAPEGNQSELILPDGSKVWVNSSSSVTYPSGFNQSARVVELKGEAYFDIAKKEKMPFVVKAGNYNVEVLGTSFNVHFNEEDDILEATLYTGSVKIYNNTTSNVEILSPSDKIILEKGSLKLKTKTTDSLPTWRSGLFDFDNISLADIVTELEKHYTVRIFIDNEQLSDYKYTAKLKHNETLEYIFQVLSTDNPFTFSKDENGYHLK